MLIVAAAVGVLVRMIWSAPVDLFFASVSVLGCMVMLERDADAAEYRMSDRFRFILARLKSPACPREQSVYVLIQLIYLSSTHTSASTSMGLMICSFIPAFFALILSSAKAFAVMATIGIFFA